MAVKQHSCSVYRYLGKDAPFASFSLSVFGIVAASCAFHGRRIITFVSGVTETLSSKPEETEAIAKLSAGLRIDFASIIKRFYGMSSGETFLFVLVMVTCLLGVLAVLSIWYLNVRLYLFYEACPFIDGTEEYSEYVSKFATHVYITTAPGEDVSNDKAPVKSELIELKKSQHFVYYYHSYSKYILDQRSLSFAPVEHIDVINLSGLAKWRGLSKSCERSDRQLGFERSLPICEEWFGDNDYAIPECDFWAMLIDSFLTPFFLFQLFSTLIWVMDNYWYYSLISIFSIVAIEVQMVNKRIRDYNRINSMRIPPTMLHVYRDMKWITVQSNKVYPGDIFILTEEASNKASVVPADCLILSGDIVVDESILTGESVPQFMSALDINSLILRNETISSNDSDMRQSTVFAGTTILLCRGSGSSFAGMKLPKQGCVCMVLRTGFESYQGRLVNAIIHSADRVTASTTEGWCFLAILLIFAICSCVFVLQRLPTASVKKLVLTALHIITSVIPPEFPVILSMAVNVSVLMLHKKGIYCTEPFRIPMAGNLDVCAFDKTGTLTEDQMKVVGIFTDAATGTNAAANPEEKKLEPLPIIAAYVIGGCHSLSRVRGETVGWPMEQSAFEYLGWSIGSDNNNIDSRHPWFFNGNKNTCKPRIVILKRFQFLYELGRMSNIVSIQSDATYWQKPLEAKNNSRNQEEIGNQAISSLQEDANSNEEYISLSQSFDGDIMVLCKGAPERVRPLLRTVPKYYDELYQQLAIAGMRILALACRRIDGSRSDIHNMVREDAEKDLEFAGFLALESPIKSSSVQCMRQLEGHKLVMITGDSVLTACHVANCVEIADRTERSPIPAVSRKWGDFAILVSSNDGFSWRLRNGDPLSHMTSSKDFMDDMDAIKKTMRLGITGPVITALLDYERTTNRKVVAEVILNVTVFARMSPQQKELVIRTFKKAGKKVAMYGDGTNDMGALKAAHVGISLLKSAVKKEPTQLETKLSGMIRKQGNDRQREALEQLKRELQDDIPELKLGEASIASPFTYRRSDAQCVPLLVRSGRCALTNVVLLYKVMGINSLITSLGMSVLALDGVNLSDGQTTLYSLIYTFMLMALSRSKPSQVTNCKRPESSVFSPANFISLVSQCCLNIGVVLYMWNLGKMFRPSSYVPDLDSPFEPNLVNTLVYYACVVVNIAGFSANYQGFPYTQPLRENRLMYRLLMGSAGLILILACDLVPPLREYLSLVPIPTYGLLLQVVVVLAADVFISVAIERLCRRMATK